MPFFNAQTHSLQEAIELDVIVPFELIKSEILTEKCYWNKQWDYLVLGAFSTVLNFSSI